ncbi:hypothetical protein KKE99_02090 [Patescibacteria group bacterium]|nr:hypothetical protein [Patescibacteria group bacterium]
MGERIFSETQEQGMENRENKEKIITDAEEARRQFRDFWKKNNSPKAVKKELKQNEEILPALKDYFKGAPKELIEEILNRQKALSKI